MKSPWRPRHAETRQPPRATSLSSTLSLRAEVRHARAAAAVERRHERAKIVDARDARPERAAAEIRGNLHADAVGDDGIRFAQRQLECRIAVGDGQRMRIRAGKYERAARDSRPWIAASEVSTRCSSPSAQIRTPSRLLSSESPACHGSFAYVHPA